MFGCIIKAGTLLFPRVLVNSRIMEGSQSTYQANPSVVFVPLSNGDMYEIFKGTGCIINHKADGTQQQLTEYRHT